MRDKPGETWHGDMGKPWETFCLSHSHWQSKREKKITGRQRVSSALLDKRSLVPTASLRHPRCGLHSESELGWAQFPFQIANFPLRKRIRRTTRISIQFSVCMFFKECHTVSKTPKAPSLLPYRVPRTQLREAEACKTFGPDLRRAAGPE